MTLPTPSITDPPNVPGDLGAVALAIEAQASAAYVGYNTSNSPSATSIETRVTAIDVQPGGTAAALDTRITTLNSAISTWTAPVGSTLTAQTARTTAFGPRQDSHDTLMSSITGTLAAAEPQISTLVSQRPGGIVTSSTTNYNLIIGSTDTSIAHWTYNFNASRFYRVSFTGSVQSTVGNVIQQVNAAWIYVSGSTPSPSGSTAGVSTTPLGMTSFTMPFACYGVIGGLSGTSTVSLYAHFSGSGGGCKVVGFGSFIFEDLGYRYY